MSLPVSQYEALLAEVRGLRRKAQRVQQLATPLLSNCSSDVNSRIHQNDGVKYSNTSYKMEPLLTGRHNNDAVRGDDGETSCCDEDYDQNRLSSTHISVSSEPMVHGDLWSVERTMWNSDPIPKSNLPSNIEVTSVMSFASSSGGALLGSPSLSRRSSQQLEAKVDMVYSLLAMLSGQEHADMGETLLALSTNPESCLAMRQSGCIPLLVQMVQSDKEAETRKKASQALHNLVHSQPDEKLRKREVRVFKLLEHAREYTEALKNHREFEMEDTSSASEDDDRHPVQTVAHLMKLSFDELHRQAICTLGGIHTIANLVEAEHVNHGSTTNEQHCILMRRYACMALTNLTFGDSGNKALLCSYREFMRALVIQLQSPSDELRQVTASVLRNLSWRADSTSKEILREVGSVTGLMKSAMLDNKENTLKSILSALWNLSAHCTENKSEICGVEGALGFLVDTLMYKTPSKSLAIIENSGGILRNISSQIAVRDDYREILRRHNCLQILLDQLKSPSLTIVSNACGTLWNLSAKCIIDQEILWQMGAPAMLRSLNHSKHKMIAMGSSAALKNLLSARPSQTLPSVMDSTALAMDLPALPTLGARKQKALMQDLDHTLSETYENLEKDSPIKKNENSDFSSLSEASTSYETRQNLSLPCFDESESNDLNVKCFIKKRFEKNDNRSFNVYSDSGLQSFEIDSGSSSSIDNDKCKRNEELKEVSVCSDEKDHCSIEDVSDSDNQSSLGLEQKNNDESSFLSSGLAVRKEIPHTSTLSTPNFKYPNLATSNVTMFEGDIDEIDMDDISIHFEEKQDTENEKKNRQKTSSIPLPRSLPRPIPSSKQQTVDMKSETPKKINRLSSGLPRLTTSTPIRINDTTRRGEGSSEAPKVENIDEVSSQQLVHLPTNNTECSVSLEVIETMEKSTEDYSYLNPVLKDERDRLLERSCEENNPMDNRMLDPDAMIQSLDRFTAELVSQASHLQSDDKYKDNTWNEDTSPNEVTFPSISGSAPNVITFDSNGTDSHEELPRKDEEEDSHEEKPIEPETNDFSSITTSTMTESTLIAIEATKMATVFKTEAEMSHSMTSLELDNVQPPSLLDSDITNSPKLTSRKKSLPRSLIARRALINSQNNGSESSENNSWSNLDQVNPPSIMGDLPDLDGSLTSISSLPEMKADFVINGAVSKNILTSKFIELENINPPSLFNEITDLCNSLTDVPTEAIGSETEIFEDCQTHIDDITEFSDANSATPIQSDPSSPEASPKKIKTIAKPMTLKQRRNLAKDRYKTYTVAAEMLSESEDFKTVDNLSTSEYQSVIDTQTFSIKGKMTPKEKRQNDRSRFETQVVEEAVTDLLQQPVIETPSPVRSRLSIRRNFIQKRLENKDRFKTQTLSSAESDVHTMVQKEANLVIKSLKETKTTTDELLECETLSLVSNDDDSEQNSANSLNYRTYHKSWGLKKNIPVIEPPPEPSTKPKIVKPSENIQEDPEPPQAKAVRGRRKPLYSKPVKPIKTMTSNLVRNVTSSIKSVKQTKPPTPQSRVSSGYGTRSNSPKTASPKPKLERQGTFTKEESNSVTPKSRIPSKIPAKTRPVTYGRSTSADNTKRVQNGASSVKRGSIPTPRSASNTSLNGSNTKKQVTSKIASLWKKIEENKNKQPIKKDTRVWIQSGEGSGSVTMRGKKREGDEGKRVSRLGSFIVMDEQVNAD